MTTASGPTDRPTALTRIVLALAGVIAFAVFSFSIPFFFSVDNLINLLNEVALAGIVAMPATFLIMSGQVDLSVGATAAFVGIVLAAMARNRAYSPLWCSPSVPACSSASSTVYS